LSITDVLEILFNFVGGLAIFLLGLKNTSEGVQAVAGNKLRKLINAATGNRMAAAGAGTIVTAAIQSSSVTTVMVVGLVNTGFMALSRALAVILGANIGTTITAWILVLNVGMYGLLILGIAGLLHLFSGKERVRFIAMTFMGVGMMYFGFELVKDGLRPLAESPYSLAAFSWLNADNYYGIIKCAITAFILSVLLQSSSTAVAIVMALAVTGLIGFGAAAAMVLGANIGKTVTALTASIGKTTNAKRAANGHVVYNLTGGVLATAFFPFFIHAISGLLTAVGVDHQDSGNIRTCVATAHTGFNVFITIIFLPLIPYVAKLLEKFTPDKRQKEVPRLTRLDFGLVKSPVIGIEQSRVEIIRMGENVMHMMNYLKTILESSEPSDKIVNKVFHRENILDLMQKEMVTFLSEFLSSRISLTHAEEARLQLRMADEYESVSDYLAEILERYIRMINEGYTLPPDDHSVIIKLHEAISFYVESVTLAIEKRNPDIILAMYSEGKSIDQRLQELRDNQLTRLLEVNMAPLVSSTYSDMLNAYHRVKDHTLNIAEALAGVK